MQLSGDRLISVLRISEMPRCKMAPIDENAALQRGILLVNVAA
jgi:hypothetical protein